MWVMIFWVCSYGCVMEQTPGFSEEAVCKAALERLVATNSMAKSVRVDGACVNADANYFE